MKWPYALILVVMGLHLMFGFWNTLYSGQNADEGFYALAARSVWQGELPYRDFGYTQMPLLPYINGALMRVIGFGLFEQRAINGLWGALTLLLAVRWLARRTSPIWAVSFGALLSLSAPWMCFIHLGKTYAFVGFMIVAALHVYTEFSPSVRQVSLVALLSTIGIGCRLTAAPFFAILWIATVSGLPLGLVRTWMKIIFGSLLWPVILLLPFYLAAPEAAYFWTMGFHQLSVPHKSWHVSGPVIIALAPALWLGLVYSLGHAVVTRRYPARQEIVVIIATLVALGTNLLPQGVYEEYGVPFLPPLALLAAVGLWRVSASVRFLRHRLIPVGLFAINLVVGVALLWPIIPPSRRSNLSLFLPYNGLAYDSTLPTRLTAQTMVVRHYLAPGDDFIGPQVILAVEAGRPVPPALRMGPFTATRDFSTAQAEKLNLATYTQLESYFENNAVPLLALSKTGNLNYAWSMPTFSNPSKQERQHWSDLFQKNFLVAYEDTDTLLLVKKSTLPTNR